MLSSLKGLRAALKEFGLWMSEAAEEERALQKEWIEAAPSTAEIEDLRRVRQQIRSLFGGGPGNGDVTSSAQTVRPTQTGRALNPEARIPTFADVYLILNSFHEPLSGDGHQNSGVIVKPEVHDAQAAHPSSTESTHTRTGSVSSQSRASELVRDGASADDRRETPSVFHGRGPRTESPCPRPADERSVGGAVANHVSGSALPPLQSWASPASAHPTVERPPAACGPTSPQPPLSARVHRNPAPQGVAYSWEQTSSSARGPKDRGQEVAEKARVRAAEILRTEVERQVRRHGARSSI